MPCTIIFWLVTIMAFLEFAYSYAIYTSTWYVIFLWQTLKGYMEVMCDCSYSLIGCGVHPCIKMHSYIETKITNLSIGFVYDREEEEQYSCIKKDVHLCTQPCTPVHPCARHVRL